MPRPPHDVFGPGSLTPAHGAYREPQDFGPLHAQFITDDDALEPLCGEWASPVLRIMKDSPVHWEAMTLMIIGLSRQIDALVALVEDLRRAQAKDQAESR